MAPRSGPITGPTLIVEETLPVGPPSATSLLQGRRLITSPVGGATTGPVTGRPIPPPGEPPVIQGTPDTPRPAVPGVGPGAPRPPTVAPRAQPGDVRELATGDQAPPDTAGDRERGLRKRPTEATPQGPFAVAAIGGLVRTAMAVPVASGKAGQRHEETGPMNTVTAMEAGLATIPETRRRAGQVGLEVGRTGAATKGVVARLHPRVPWRILITPTGYPTGEEAAWQTPLQTGET